MSDRDPVPNRLSDPAPTPNRLTSMPAPQPESQPRPTWAAAPDTEEPRSAGRGPFGAILGLFSAGRAVVFVIAVLFAIVRGCSPSGDAPSGFAVPSPSGSPTQLYQTGQCLDVTTSGPEAGQEVRSVDLVILSSCDGAHDGEIVEVVAMPTPSGGGYPRIIEFDVFADATCGPAFVDYLGVAAGGTFPFQWSYMFPWDQYWAAGDHAIVCYLERFDGAEWTGPARDAVVRASQTP